MLHTSQHLPQVHLRAAWNDRPYVQYFHHQQYHLFPRRLHCHHLLRLHNQQHSLRQGRIQKFHLGATRRRRRRGRAPQAPRSSAAGARIEAAQAPRGVGCGDGVSPPHWGGVWGGGCALPRKFFQYWIIKWPVLVDSDMLRVLLIVVVKLETCT